MSRRCFAALVISTVWVGLLTGQACPGFYEEQVASDNGGLSDGSDSTGGDHSAGGQTGGTSDGDPPGATSIVDVEIDNTRFTPKSVTISAGQAVRWTNHEFTPHAIRSGNPDDDDKGELFRSSSLGIGASFQHTLNQPGTYYYHCEYMYRHANLRDATVVVTGSPTQ